MWELNNYCFQYLNYSKKMSHINFLMHYKTSELTNISQKQMVLPNFNWTKLQFLALKWPFIYNQSWTPEYDWLSAVHVFSVTDAPKITKMTIFKM